MKKSLGIVLILFLCCSLVSAACTESDNGKDYFNRGEIYINSNPANIDWCATVCHIKEFYCENGINKSLYYKCPNGCDINGYCIKNPGNMTEYCKDFPSPPEDVLCLDTDGGENIYVAGSVITKEPYSKSMRDPQTKQWVSYGKTFARDDFCGTREEIWADIRQCSGNNCGVYEYTCSGEGEYMQPGEQVYYSCPFGCNDGACNKPTKPSPIIEADIGNAKYSSTRLDTICQTILGFVDAGCVYYTANYQGEDIYVSVRIEDHVKKVDEKQYIDSIEESTTRVKAKVAAYGLDASAKLIKNSDKNVFIFDRQFEGKRNTAYMWLSDNKILELEFQIRDEADESFVDAYLNKHPSDLNLSFSFYSLISDYWIYLVIFGFVIVVIIISFIIVVLSKKKTPTTSSANKNK